MKSKKHVKHLHRVIILIMLIGVVAVSTSLNADSQKQMREQRTDEVLLVIDEKLNEFVSADKNDRNYKINAFKALWDFQTQLNDQDIQFDRVDSEFSVIMNQIVDWFYNNYIGMINEIAQEATEDISEIQQYLFVLSAEIDSISEHFFGDEFSSDEVIDEVIDEEFIDEEVTDEEEYIGEELAPDDADAFDERLYRLELFEELNGIYEIFMEDDFISLRLDANEERVKELNKVLNLIEDENIIDSERQADLNNKIDSLVEVFTETDRATVIEADDVLYRFEEELSLQRLWFEEHYSLLLDEILNMVREDEYDDVTVINQIEELKLVTQFIEDDGVVCSDFLLLMSEQIEQIVEVYESELVTIEERIKQRNIEKANAAAASSNNSGAAASTSGSRTGTSNNSNSNTSSSSGSSGSSSSSSSGSSSSSSSNNSSSSGSGNNNTSGNSSGSLPVSGNNNYPAISSNCREMLARLVRLEAPNESADGKQAVAEVVLNRMVSSRWSHANSVEDVIFDDKWGVQFTVKDRIWTEKGNPSASDYAAVDRALSGSNLLSRSYVYFNTKPVTQNDVIWIGVHAFSK